MTTNTTEGPALEFLLKTAKTKAELQDVVRGLQARNRHLEEVIRNLTTEGTSMTINPHRTDFEYRLARLERGTDAADARLQEIARTHREIVAQLQSMTEDIERTDAGVTHICWTLDRIVAALKIDKETE